VPKLEQLYSRKLAVIGWGLWVVAIIAGSAVILLEWNVLPVIGALMLGAAACFLINVFGIARHWTLGQRLSLREPVVPRRKPAT
jgi:hypothetical protein